MRTCAVIVAGGRSSRMGQEKALSIIRGRTIMAHVIARLAPQVTEIAINTNGDPDRFAAYGLTIVADRRVDVGTPLAGLHAALALAREKGFDAVLTVPSDAPFLPGDLVPRLAQEGRRAAIAASGGQQHYLTGLWSHHLLAEVERALARDPRPRLQDWARMCDAAVVAWPALPYDPFFNVNTPGELAEAERIAAEFEL